MFIKLFIFGLSKKILIADNLAPYANYTFANISSLTFNLKFG